MSVVQGRERMSGLGGGGQGRGLCGEVPEGGEEAVAG